MADENKKYKDAINLTATLNKQIAKMNDGFTKGGEAHAKQLRNYKSVVDLSVKATEAGTMSEKSLKRRTSLISALSDKTKDMGELSVKSRNIGKEINALKKKRNWYAENGHDFQKETMNQSIKELNTDKKLVDEARDKLAVVEAEAKKTDVLDKLTGGLFSKAKEMKKTYDEQGKSVGMQTFKWISIGALVGLAVKALTGFSKKIDEIGQTFGVLASDTQFTENIITAEHAAIALGKGMGDVLSTMGSLSSEFGITLGEASKLSGKIIDTAMATGLSNDEATKLFGSFMQIGGLSSEAAENLTESTFQLAKQNGVAPSQVLKDIAGSTETMATFSKGTSENLFEAAVAARQLGLNIDTIAKSARGMLNFQESLNAEIEASLMLGKDLDFSKARELAYNKDIAGFQEEIKNQLGDIGDFRELDVFQQESLANALNMSVAETAKLVSGTEKLSLAGALSAGNFEDLAGEDALSNLSKMVNKFKELGATLLDKLGGPLSDAVGALYDLFTEAENLTWMEEKIGGISGFFKGLPDMIGSAWAKLKLGIGIMTGLKVASLGFAMAQAAAMAFGVGTVTLGVGLLPILAGIAAAWGTIAALPSFQDKAPSQIAMVGHQDGTFGNEAIITPDPIVKALEEIREDNKTLAADIARLTSKGIGGEFRTMKSGI